MLVMSLIAFALPGIPAFAFVTVYLLVFCGTLIGTLVDVVMGISDDLSYALAIPLGLSVLMNLFLASLAPNLGATVAMVLLSSNILYAGIVALVGVVVEFRRGTCAALLKYAVVLLVGLVAYAGVLFLFNPVSFTSFASTLRNLIAPFVFLVLGLVLAGRCRISGLCFWVFVYGLVVSLFGLYEVFLSPLFWKSANIGELWDLKGIGVSKSTGLPSNFYSSESIGGNLLRRMSSLFADPVNLGTFLFAFLAIAWYCHRWVFVALAGVCCLLTVSKGALIGVLVLVLAYVWVRFGKSLYTRLAFGGVAAAATAFLVYSMLFTTGSVAAHMSGFVGGIKSIFRNPLGYGCGNVGILAVLTNDNHVKGLEESGFGVIAGEVGIVGVAIYAAMFVLLVVAILRVKDAPTKTLLLTLLGSIAANILFNEVALSPNSCGLFFSIIGLLVGGKMTGALEGYGKTDEKTPEVSPRGLDKAYRPRHLRPGTDFDGID